MPDAQTSTDALTSTDPDLAAIQAQAITAAEGASAKHATDVVILGVGQLLGITDYFVLFSTASDRQLGAAVEEAERMMRETHDRRPMGREGSKESGWMVVDYGDFVLHGFTAAQREVYDLERLWGDAPRVPYTDPALADEAPTTD